MSQEPIRAAGSRAAVVKFSFVFLVSHNPEVVDWLENQWKMVLTGEVARPEGVSTSRITEILDTIKLAKAEVAPKSAPRPVVPEAPAIPNPMAILPLPPPMPPPTPIPVSVAPVPPPPAPMPIKSTGTLRDLHVLRLQQEQEFRARMFVPKECEQYLEELLAIEEELDLPAPMARVRTQGDKKYLIIGTAKFNREESVDHIGMDVDHFDPDKHPNRVRDKTGPITRSNRDRRKSTEPARVMWARAIELHGEAFIRYWFNPGGLPHETQKPKTTEKYFHILETGQVREISEEEYDASN